MKAKEYYQLKKHKIEWTEKTINPLVGCTKISDGCKHCYAERMTNRLKSMGLEKYKNGFDKVVFFGDELDKIDKIKKPTMIFLCSMSDVFHDGAGYARQSILNKIKRNPQHIFQILTKRTEVLKNRSYSSYPNLWLGVTIESYKYLKRLDDLKQTDAKTKFISFEPLLSKIPEIDLTGIDWVIVGGETGIMDAREMETEWAENLLEQCRKQNVPFFFKSTGTFGPHNKLVSGWSRKSNLLNGQLIQEFPKIYYEWREKA